MDKEPTLPRINVCKRASKQRFTVQPARVCAHRYPVHIWYNSTATLLRASFASGLDDVFVAKVCVWQARAISTAQCSATCYKRCLYVC